MATLFLIRHGLTAQTGTILYGQSPGVHLDARGQAQAEDLARRMAPIRLTAVYSSPLERCVQTVQPLAADKRLPIVERPELIEMDAGTWTGKRLSALRRKRAEWTVVQTHPSAFGFPGGEGFADAQERAVLEVRRIARRHRRGRVAFQRFVADPASVSVVEVGSDGNAYLVLMNETGGLDRFGAAAHPPWEASPDGRGRGRSAKLRG
jgi:probable phosphoglycerate mutase